MVGVMAISRAVCIAALLGHCADADSAPSTTFCENCRSEAATAAKGSLAAEPLQAKIGGLMGLSAEDPSTTFCENCKTDMTLPKADVSQALGMSEEQPPSTTFCENCKTDSALPKADVSQALGMSEEQPPSTTFCENCKTDSALPKADVSQALGMSEEQPPSTTFCENCKTDSALPKADVGESLMLAEDAPSTTFCENCRSESAQGALPVADVGAATGLDAVTTTFCENCRSAGDLRRRVVARWQAAGRRALRSRGAQAVCGASLLLLAAGAVVGPLLARRARRGAAVACEVSDEGHLLLDMA